MDSLLVVGQAVGALVLAGVLFLLFKRIIVIDQETQHVTEFHFPILGKVKTQSPVLILALIGAFLVVYPIHVREPNEITLEGSIDAGGRSVDIVVVAVPRYQTSVHKAQGPTNYSMPIPLLPKNTYRVRFFVDDTLIQDVKAKEEAGRLRVPDINWQPTKTGG